MKLFLITILTSALFLSGCETMSQDVYDYREAGQSVIVEFGTVVDVRQIKIKGPNSGAGAVTGAVAGGALGSQVGSGDGQGAAMIVGAVAGLAAGAVAEQALQDKTGRDFVIVLQNGKTITVSQYFKKDEPIIKQGQRVMVQTSGSYQRVLPADHLPETIKRPKGIKVVD
jgi:outer membrane lipoprotein SlyB